MSLPENTAGRVPTKRAWPVRSLQIVIAILTCVPVTAGLAGVLWGPPFLGVEAPWPADLDSHFRFLSGTFLVLGIAWWSCIPDLPNKGSRLRLLALMTFGGGLARLASLGIAGAPSAGHLAGLVLELALVPALVFWHWRIAAK